MVISAEARSESSDGPSTTPSSAQTKGPTTIPGGVSYRSLDDDASEIRLLHILPGTGHDLIRCELVHNSLDHAPTSFIALSYAWGYVDVRHTIYIDNRPCLVSKSVLGTLQALRSQPVLDQYDRNVWIDAVCINQTDLLEKSKQVRMMSRIYSEATMVVAWLGSMTAAEQRGYTLIEQIISAFQLVNEYEQEGSSVALPESDTASFAAQIGLPYIQHKAWDDVRAVFQKPWFTRVWIVQECILATEFYFLYDTQLVSPELLFVFCSNFMKYPWLKEAVSQSLGRRLDDGTVTDVLPAELWKAPTLIVEWRTHYRDGTRWPMTVCMSRCAILNATDLRDRIFAMVSLCSDTDESIIDYSAELKDVLIKVSINYITGSGKRCPGGVMDMLSAIQELKQIPGLPSWVLCGSRSNTGLIGLHYWFSTGSPLNYLAPLSPNQEVRGERVPVLAVDPEHSALLVSARSVDRISTILDASHVYPSWSSGRPSRDMMMFSNPDFTHWILDSLKGDLKTFSDPFRQARRLSELVKEYPNGCTIEECFWRSRFSDDQHELPDEQLGFHIEAYLKLTEQIIPRMTELARIRGAREVDPEYLRNRTAADLRNEEEWEELGDEHDATFLALKSALRPFDFVVNQNRSLAITEHGLIAWVTYRVEVGDEIMVVDGTRVPIAFRRADSTTDVPWSEDDQYDVPQFGQVRFPQSWRVVGDVYLHGFMTGSVDRALEPIADQVGERKMIRIV